MKEPTFEEIMNHERKKWRPAEPVEQEPKRRGRKPKKVETDGE